MTELIFTMGASIRKVFIKGRKISLVTPELKFMPLMIDLDRLNEASIQEKLKGLNPKQMKEILKLSKLGSEKEIIDDIVNDFKESGWGLAKTIK